MSILTSRRFFSRQLLHFVVFVFSIFGIIGFLQAEEVVQPASSPTTKTLVADFMLIDGDLFIVRGDRGEIQIEITPDTKISEKFTLGDRIKAILLPNDVAQSIMRATPDEPVGFISNEKSTPPTPAPSTAKTGKKTGTTPRALLSPTHEIPKVRIIIADLLMVDGSFYIVRDSEYGEIQIEITAETERSEEFKFGDTIKARITPSDKALSVVRASQNDPKGIQDEIVPASNSAKVPAPAPLTPSPMPSEKKMPESTVETTPSLRTIVADVLMVEGDFYIVRGEKGEIRIEVTPKTAVSGSFDYGDRIKATVSPNDKALTIERANPNDPVGITTP